MEHTSVGLADVGDPVQRPVGAGEPPRSERVAAAELARRVLLAERPGPRRAAPLPLPPHRAYPRHGPQAPLRVPHRVERQGVPAACLSPLLALLWPGLTFSASLPASRTSINIRA